MTSMLQVNVLSSRPIYVSYYNVLCFGLAAYVVSPICDPQVRAEFL